jgi:hypothetical protein
VTATAKACGASQVTRLIEALIRSTGASPCKHSLQYGSNARNDPVMSGDRSRFRFSLFFDFQHDLQAVRRRPARPDIWMDTDTKCEPTQRYSVMEYN